MTVKSCKAPKNCIAEAGWRGRSAGGGCGGRTTPFSHDAGPESLCPAPQVAMLAVTLPLAMRTEVDQFTDLLPPWPTSKIVKLTSNSAEAVDES